MTTSEEVRPSSRECPALDKFETRRPHARYGSRNQIVRIGETLRVLAEQAVRVFDQNVVETFMREKEEEAKPEEYQRQYRKAIAVSLSGCLMIALAVLVSYFQLTGDSRFVLGVIGYIVGMGGIALMPSNPEHWIQFEYERYVARRDVPDKVKEIYRLLRPLLPDAHFYILEFGADPIFCMKVGGKVFYLWVWGEPRLAEKLFPRHS